MALTPYFHPLAAFCHKVLVALYENDIDFQPVTIDLGDPGSAAALGGYFERLLERPSVRRTLAEARPYFSMFPYRDAMPERFLELQPG